VFASEPEVKLLYEVEVPGMLDAATGEFVGPGAVLPQDELREVPAGAAPLKPASLPLTAETAKAFSLQVLELPEEAEGWNLWIDQESEDASFIELYWSGPDGGANVRLDRETGRVLGAYRGFDDYYTDEEAADPTPEEKEAALQEAIRVVQRLYGDLVSDLKVDPQGRQPFYHGRISFHFQRYVHGIPYDSDGVHVTVDHRTGKWTDITLIWTGEVEAPAPEGIISPEEAHQGFFEDSAVELVYDSTGDRIEIFPRTAKPLGLALVYQLQGPASEPGFYGIDAFTGEPVMMRTGDAAEVDRQIAGHWAEGEIRFLLSRYLLGADALNPDRPVTRAEAVNLLIWVYREFKGYWSGRSGLYRCCRAQLRRAQCGGFPGGPGDPFRRRRVPWGRAAHPG